MNRLKHWLIWLSRIHCCRGFGIQSPTDYAFVRYVVNEHWPYYAYGELHDDDWLHEKLGQLYFRLANWWQAGCRKMRITKPLEQVEWARIDIEDIADFYALLPLCNQQSVVVVENIWRNKARWQQITRDNRTGTTFDLYYCGIVFFDTKRYKHNYKINF